MKLHFTYLFVFFFLTQITFGQTKEAKQISGKILAESTSVEAVNVINNTTQRTTVSDANGLFSIVVNEGDVLIFSAVNLESLRKKITKQDLLLDVVKVQMTAKSIDLKEVIINEHPEITAENIGVIPYGQKKYTPAERKIYTANSTVGDKLLNSISGRTAMLEKEAVVEKKELNQWFLNITKYSDQLLKSLDGLKGWPEKVRLMQKNWIGKSVGCEINFISNFENTKIKIFTTRPDTIFGASFIAIAPDHG